MTTAFAPRRTLARFRYNDIAPLGRIPFPLLALAMGLAFVAVGVAVADDYGASSDEYHQRILATRNAAYIMGDRDALPKDPETFLWHGL